MATYEAVSGNFQRMSTYAWQAPWKIAVSPFRVAPRVYYVGNEWVGIYLVDTEEGLILVDTAVAENTYLLLDAIRTMGFDPRQIRHIFLSHSHGDHDGGAKQVQEYAGAKIWMSKEEDDFRKVAPRFGKEFISYPYDVDCYYDDSTPMRFGSVTIQTKLTPGHTPGCTSFFITMPDDKGGTLMAAMHGGVGVLTMTDAALDELNLPHSLRRQFINDCQDMKKIHVDIALPSHPAHGNLFERVKPAKDSVDYSPMVDEKEWGVFLDSRIAFVEDMEKQ